MILISTNVPFASQDAFYWPQRMAARAVRSMESFVTKGAAPAGRYARRLGV